MSRENVYLLILELIRIIILKNVYSRIVIED